MADGRTIKVSVDIVQGSTGGSKKAMIDVERDVAASQQRIEANTKKTDAAINASKRASAAAQIKENKTIANDFLRTLKNMESEAKASSSRVNSSFSSAFKGGFLGSLTGIISSQLAQLPSMFKATLDEMVSIAAERQNAFKGLESIASFKGVDQKAAQDAVMNLRLVKAGIVEITEASTGLKNLLATGFSLPQSITLLERFSDSAAFGKQSALGFGEAIRSATEGLKNGNSILLDNAGVTKNTSNILEEHGKKKTDVSQITADASVREAVYAGLIKETSGQVGDANKLINTYTGSTAALAMAQNNLYAAIGDLIIRNPAYLESNRQITNQLNTYTSQVGKADSETAKFTNNSITNYALLRASAIPDIAAIGKTFAMVSAAVATAAYGILTGLTAVTDAVVGSITYAVKGAYNSFVWLQNKIADLGLGGAIGRISPVENNFDNFSNTKIVAGYTATMAAATAQLKREADALMAEGRAARAAIRNAVPPGTRGGWLGGGWSQPQQQSPLPDPGGTTGGNKTGGIDLGQGGGRRGGSGGGQKPRSILPEFGSMQKLVISSGNPQWDAWFTQMGRKYNVDPNILLLQVQGESSFKAGAVSPKGAQGFSQIMPETAKRFGVDVSSVKDSIRGQAQYMQFLLGMFGGNYEKALAGYNAGEGNVQKFNGIPPFAETRDYVAKIKTKYAQRVRTSGAAEYGTFGDTSEEVEKILRERSDALTKADREKFLRQMIEFHKKAGTIPSPELMDDIYALMVEDVKQTGRGTFGMNKADAMASLFAPIQMEIRGKTIGRTASQLIPNNTSEVIDSIIPREIDEKAAAAADVYRQLADDIWALRDATFEENLERAISLGLYKDLNPELIDAARNTARLKDAAEQKKKADEAGRDALEKYRDQQRQVFQDTENFFRYSLRGLVDGGFKGLWQSLLDSFKRQFVDRAANMLANLFSGNRNAATWQSGNSGGGFGGVFSGLFGGSGRGGFGGGIPGQGPGGTPMFNGGSNSTSSGGGGGGFLSNLFGRAGGAAAAPAAVVGGGGINNSSADVMARVSAAVNGGGGGGWMSRLGMGPQKNLLTGKMSSLGGMMGGIGSIATIAGSMIGGRLGNTLQYAGMGAQLGANFGPWGAAIGAGIGALVGLFGKRDNAIKKLKQAALSQFGLNVKDKGTLEQLKAIGEGMFGKGNVGTNAAAVVGSEEGMNILRAYAEATGQSTKQLDRLNYGDVNWTGNNFRSQFRGFGSSGSSGYSVAPRAMESYSPSGGGASTGGGMSSRVIGGLIQSIEMLTEQVAQLKTEPEGVIVKRGLTQNPAAAADAYEYELENDGRRGERLTRLTGAYV